MTHPKRIIKATYHAFRKKGREGGIAMRKLVVAAVRLIGATIAGLLLSELGVIVGFLLFDRAVGIWFLPVVLGIGRRRHARLGHVDLKDAQLTPHHRSRRSKA